MSLILIGDTVLLEVCKENREWGFNPGEDGTPLEVLGFSEIDWGYVSNYGKEPGIYENRCWIDVKFPNGKVENISTCHVRLPGNILHDRIQQNKLWRQTNQDDVVHPDFEAKKLRDLPETKFWVGDKVRNNGSRYENERNMQIVRIDYREINAKRSDGSPWPFYTISNNWMDVGWTMSAEEGQLELMERGPVWKHYHGRKIDFASLEEEAVFYHKLGFTTEVRNPKNGVYRWDTVEEVLDAIQSGIADGFSVSRGVPFFGGDKLHHSLMKYKNRDLGERVRAATLAGFGRPVPVQPKRKHRKTVKA